MNSLQRESIARRYVEIRQAQDFREHGTWHEHAEVADVMYAWLEAFGLITPVPSGLVNIETATGAVLDALAGVAQRPAGMSDAELRERIPDRASPRPMVLGDLSDWVVQIDAEEPCVQMEATSDAWVSYMRNKHLTDMVMLRGRLCVGN